MKKLTLLLFLILCLQLNGQDATATTNFNRQIGIDATSLLNLFFNSDDFNGNPYFLNFKKANKKGNFRFGFGGNFQVEKFDGGTNSSSNFHLRFGTERYIDFADRWRGFYGWDFRTNLSFASFENLDNNQIQIALGGAPILGLQFRINSRLSLSTETAYNLFFMIRHIEGDTNYRAFSSFRAPSFLYFNFDF